MALSEADRAGEKAILLECLQQNRDDLLWKLEGLSEFDRRRAMTPTGTNLLGLVKHLAGLEYSYLGGVFGRPAPEKLSWEEDGSIWQNADMWVTAAQSTDYITGLYRRACAHADRTVAELDLDTIGVVPWWPEGRKEATLRRLLVRMVGETARHTGHADIVRELADGAAGSSHTADDQDAASVREYVARINAAAAEAAG
ncbi:MAG TPA: DinB family protein [Mycobacteriales bacterium]|jgi:hypothetical protein|nr:DinB family protein [Mycobacteriales bacterium]